jgi:hypothetical protein
VLDVPCGGVALPGLRPDPELDYVAADLSRVMLGRAPPMPSVLGIHWIEFAEADVESLPFEERSFDLIVTTRASTASRTRPRRSRRWRGCCGRGGELLGTWVIKRTGDDRSWCGDLSQLAAVAVDYEPSFRKKLTQAQIARTYNNHLQQPRRVVQTGGGPRGESSSATAAGRSPTQKGLRAPKSRPTTSADTRRRLRGPRDETRFDLRAASGPDGERSTSNRLWRVT